MLEDNFNEDAEEGKKSLVQRIRTQAKEYLVDTSAALIYGNLVYGSCEYFLVGMENEQFIKTRIAVSVSGLFTSRLFGKFREYWAKWCKTDADSSPKRKYLTDLSGDTLFYSPIYVGVMYCADASLGEIGIALTIATAIATVSARAYGWFLDKWRKGFGVKPTLDKMVKKDNLSAL